MIVLEYIKALLLPAGRLPRDSFLVMIFSLSVLHAVVVTREQSSADIYGLWGVAVLLVFWMKFCVLTRRLHDLGRGNGLAFLLFVLTTVTHLASCDPSLFGNDPDTQETVESWIGLALHVVRIGWLFLVFDLVRSDGDRGPNLYGPEFGSAGLSWQKHEDAKMALADTYAAQRGIAMARHTSSSTRQSRLDATLSRSERPDTEGGGVLVPRAERMAQAAAARGPQRSGFGRR
jgi:uncharacterized membrane protein YhaH (DUF805 family)